MDRRIELWLGIQLLLDYLMDYIMLQSMPQMLMDTLAFLKLHILLQILFQHHSHSFCNYSNFCWRGFVLANLPDKKETRKVDRKKKNEL